MRLIFSLVTILVTVQMGAGNTFAAENQPVTLGAIYGLTGEWSAYDVPSSRGAKLFVTQANEKGGVLGRPINLIIKDVESARQGSKARGHDLVRTPGRAGPLRFVG